MTPASRQLVHWLLTAALERGVDPWRALGRSRQAPPHRSRVLTRAESAALARWPSRVYYLAPRR